MKIALSNPKYSRENFYKRTSLSDLAHQGFLYLIGESILTNNVASLHRLWECVHVTSSFVYHQWSFPQFCANDLTFRWGHSGYRELYPEEFESQSDVEEEQKSKKTKKRKETRSVFHDLTLKVSGHFFYCFSWLETVIISA